MNLRKGKMRDYEEVIEMMNLCKYDFKQRSLNVWDENYPSNDMIENDLKTGNSVVCLECDRVVGFLALLPNEIDLHEECFNIHQNFCLIKRVMVHPNYRRKGYAYEMFKYLETLGYDGLRLTARDENIYAINLYDKLKYEKVASVEYPWSLMNVYEKRIKLS